MCSCDGDWGVSANENHQLGAIKVISAPTGVCHPHPSTTATPGTVNAVGKLLGDEREAQVQALVLPELLRWGSQAMGHATRWPGKLLGWEKAGG